MHKVTQIFQLIFSWAFRSWLLSNETNSYVRTDIVNIEDRRLQRSLIEADRKNRLVNDQKWSVKPDWLLIFNRMLKWDVPFMQGKFLFQAAFLLKLLFTAHHNYKLQFSYSTIDRPIENVRVMMKIHQHCQEICQCDCCWANDTF